MQKHSKEYDRYMRSEQWKAKRQERLGFDGDKCRMCGRPNRSRSGKPCLQIHHVTYVRLGDEDVANDLINLCPACHKRIHNYYRRREPIEKEVI